MELKKLRNGSDDLKDIKDAGYGKLLIVEIGIDGDITEHIRR